MVLREEEKKMALLLSSSVAGRNGGREEREGWVDGEIDTGTPTSAEGK